MSELWKRIGPPDLDLPAIRCELVRDGLLVPDALEIIQEGGANDSTSWILVRFGDSGQRIGLDDWPHLVSSGVYAAMAYHQIRAAVAELMGW